MRELEGQGRRLIQIRNGDDLEVLVSRRFAWTRRSGQDLIEMYEASRAGSCPARRPLLVSRRPHRIPRRGKQRGHCGRWVGRHRGSQIYNSTAAWCAGRPLWDSASNACKRMAAWGETEPVARGRSRKMTSRPVATASGLRILAWQLAGAASQSLHANAGTSVAPGHSECEAGILVAATKTGGYLLRHQSGERPGDGFRPIQSPCHAHDIAKSYALGDSAESVSATLVTKQCGTLCRVAATRGGDAEYRHTSANRLALSISRTSPRVSDAHEQRLLHRLNPEPSTEHASRRILGLHRSDVRIRQHTQHGLHYSHSIVLTDSCGIYAKSCRKGENGSDY